MRPRTCDFSSTIGMVLVCMIALTAPQCLAGKDGASRAGRKSGVQPTPGNGAAGYTMPFELESGFLIVVKGRIGPSTTLRFALDTGTTHSMVDAKIADALSLKLQDGFVLNFDRDVRISWTTVPELSVGPLSLKDARVMVGNRVRRLRARSCSKQYWSD